MIPQRNIILVGFMGTGKTTVGSLLAAATKRPFIDTDARIEAETQQTIPQIFATHGEAHFRQMEARLAQRLAQQQGLIIATGGGLVLNPASRAALARSGTIYCLVASASQILARLQQDAHQRPLLNVPNPQARLAHLLAQRAPIYGRFPQIDTSHKTPAQIVQQILNQQPTAHSPA